MSLIVYHLYIVPDAIKYSVKISISPEIELHNFFAEEKNSTNFISGLETSREYK